VAAVAAPAGTNRNTAAAACGVAAAVRRTQRFSLTVPGTAGGSPGWEHGWPSLRAVERVTGIGGLFLRSSDPDRLGRWYAEHLGVDPPPTSYDEPVWEQEAGPTVWAVMPPDTEMFGRPEQQWMVNFRVRDLAAMVSQLQGAGITVDVDPEEYPIGRFAQLADPDGNPIQLWEPT